MHFLRCLAVVSALTFTLHAAEEKLRLVRETDALTPEQEQAGFHVPPGFEVQLFASEPQINKPINMAFDARGRLWVSSAVEYPYAAEKSRWSDAQGTHVKGSRDAIKILEDTDSDGKADKVTDFANELNIPTGVPLVYELDDHLKPLKHYYLGDQEAIAAAMAAVASQGKAK